MLDLISIIAAILLAVIIYVVVAKRGNMWPFDKVPLVPIAPGPVIPQPSPVKPANALSFDAIQNSKMRNVLLFVLIFVLLLIAMIIANMVKSKKCSSPISFRYCR